MKNNKAGGGVVIGGYYGFGNLGDEAILDSAVRALRGVLPAESMCVLSASPEETEKRLGVCSVQRKNIFKVVSKMCSSSLYISGGGGLLQDDTSRRSLWFYLLLMKLGKRLCGHACVFANGVGNIRQKKLAARALRCADRVSVRDAESAKRLSEMGIFAEVCADPVFAMPFLRERRERFGYYAVCLRHGERVDLDALSSFCNMYRRRGLQAMFISMQEGDDDSLCREAAARCGGRFVSPQSFEFLEYLLSGAEFAVGMRLHFLIGAARVDVPFVSLGGDCKLSDFVDLWGCGARKADASGGAGALSEAVESAKAAHSEFEKERAERKAQLSSLAEEELTRICGMCVSLCGHGHKKEISLGEI